MANGVYYSFLQALAEGYFGGSTPPDPAIYLCGVDSTYVFDRSDSTVEELGESVVAPPVALENANFTDGILSADDMVPAWSGIDAGETIAALVLFELDSNGDTQLMAYIDTSSTGSLPYEIIGVDIAVRWDTAGIFRI